MSETASNVVTYTRRDADAGRLPALRLTLEPERVEGANRATLADIDAMLALARSGASARNRQINRCKWASWAENGDLLCTLKLWVWPSDINLAYALTLPPGVTSADPVLVREPKDTKFWVAGSGGEIELPWLLENAAFVWHPAIGVWDAWSRPASPPAIRQDKARLNLDGERDRYGVLHVRGTAVGFRHDLTIRYPTGKKPAGVVQSASSGLDYSLYIAAAELGNENGGPGISIKSADSFEARATWRDENGEQREESATMNIPECVRALLEECPNGTTYVTKIRMQPPEGDLPVTVYYNTCNGNILDVRWGRR